MSTSPERCLIDAHVHVGSVGPTPEDGVLSPRLLRGPVAGLARRRLGVARGDLMALTRAYLARLEADLAASRFVRQAVVLALDGVYDSSGRIDLARTVFYVPNDYVLGLAKRNPAFLAGASINPERADALDELARVAEAGAVLIKWLPNAQVFDPGAAASEPFFRELARRRLPLLVHSGLEFAVPSDAQEMSEPGRLRRALEAGVEVIAAHGGSSGLPLGLGARRERTFLALLDRFPNLHADSSALGVPNRSGMIRRLARWPGAVERLTFGTDYPVGSFPSVLLARGRLRAFLAARREPNPFDRQVLILRGLGWEPSSAVLERLIAKIVR